MEPTEPQWEGQGRNPEMNDREKSNACVVPAKPVNEAVKTVEESVEGRRAAKEKQRQQNALRTQSRESTSNALARLREVARRDKKNKFTALLHHVNQDMLRVAYWEMNRQATAGVDGMTWKEYGQNLEVNIEDLLGRVHRGAYRPQPARRAFIPKADGTQRPLGIAALEDKLLQAGVSRVLEAIYEEDFLGFCYGYRPHTGPHDALDALATALLRKKVNWVLDADIRGFFDSISHEWMQTFLEHRIGDRRIIRLNMKWLKSGVMEKGEWSETESGTPQGATISPLLANIYLFHVFDQWAHHWRRKHARGEVVIVRYADDLVVGFERKDDAEQFWRQLDERLQKFALKLHPEKTRLIEFGRYAAERRSRRKEGKPETFTFLGLRHICSTNLSGRYTVLRVTDSKRMSRTLHEIGKKLKYKRHDPVPEQGKWLRSVVTGWDNYYAVPGNYFALICFRRAIFRLWRHALRRRSQRSRTTNERVERLMAEWLPDPKIRHPWPDARFDVRIRGKNRMR